MKKLTRDETDKMLLKTGRTSRVRATITIMEVGEILLIEPKDWKSKASPSLLMGRITEATGRKYKLSKSMDGLGWVVERLK